MIDLRMARTPLVLALIVLASTTGAAAQTVKEECVAAHSQAQDAREQSKWSLARQLFVSCAQTECPALVQADCARLADELQRYQPWITFAARDDHGHDLPDTTVYVDGVLVATRLDGRAHDLDPGAHVVRFVRGERKFETNIVVGEGERGRVVTANFETPVTMPPPARLVASPARVERPRTRPAVLALVGGGSALLASGGALVIAGLVRVPNNCSLSTHACEGPPDDPSLDRAARAVRLSNVGWGLAGAGAVALAGGLIWHFMRSNGRERSAHLTPWAAPSTAGVALSGRL